MTLLVAGTAARQANGRLAHGPVTPEGQERSRSSNVRHGFYSQEPLIALGEDPQEYADLMNSLAADWTEG